MFDLEEGVETVEDSEEISEAEAGAREDNLSIKLLLNAFDVIN
jgi:hypothetical protein